MRLLVICSYTCAVFAIILWGLLVSVMVNEGEADRFFILFLFLLLPPLAQVIYTARTYPLISLPVYKETESLDDFMLNELDSNERVVSTGFWLKTFSVINSILLCLLFLLVSYLFRGLMYEVSRLSFSKPEDFALLFMLMIYLFALPTVLYNLRTFNLKRIRTIA